jgi:hypothetical protein
MSKPDSLENRALKVILEAEEQGILQSDLWRALGANSREGSRLALKLEKKKLVRRERELLDGRWTYRLFAMRRQATVDSILGIPCTTCPVVVKCCRGGETSPETCEKMELWLLETVGGGEPAKEE